nr:uncharacterized protein LOC112797505 isoform X4 [Arachis hypogaea]
MTQGVSQMQTGSCAYENPAFVFDGELYLPKLSFMSLFNFHVASVSLQKSASNYRGSWILTFSLLTCALFKLKEWILVLLTLLRSSEVLFDLFHHDVRLWKAYSTMLQPADSFKIYWKRRLLQ